MRTEEQLKNLLEQVTSKFKRSQDKTIEKLKDYDMQATRLNERAWKILEIKCKSFYETMEKNHIEKSLPPSALSPERQNYLDCKKFFTHDSIEFLEFTNRKYAHLLEKHAFNLQNCEFDFRSKKAEEIQNCYEVAFQKHFIELGGFIDEANRILKRKVEYVSGIERRFNLLV